MAVQDTGAGDKGVRNGPTGQHGHVTQCPAEVYEYDWDWGEACAVSWCESRWLPWAYNAGNYGLFQVNAVHQARVRGDLDSLFDPAINTAVAYAIWRDSYGWGPWACKPY